MAETYSVEIKVISQKGKCDAGHKEGDTWTMGAVTPASLCAAAFASMLPDIRALRLGGVLPWSKDKDSAIVACPDPDNPVVFKIRRIQ